MQICDAKDTVKKHQQKNYYKHVTEYGHGLDTEMEYEIKLALNT